MATFTHVVEDMFNDFTLESFRRLKVQSVSVVQDYTNFGYAAYAEWITPSVASGAKAYAEFTVPADKYAILDNREIITDKERVFYKVYVTYGAVSNTASIPIYRMRNDGPSFPVILYKTTAPSVAPTSPILTVPVFGVPAGGGKGSGDIAGSDEFRMLSPGSKFLLEISNDSTQAAYVQVNLLFSLLPLDKVRPL